MKILALLLASALPVLAGPLITSISDFEVKGREDCWTIENGVLVGQSAPDLKGSVLWTKSRFKDFTLEGEFRFTNPIDSGIFLRTEVDQIQLGVSRSLKRDMTGSPYISKTAKYPARAEVEGVFKNGEWNKIAIAAKGNRYLVSINGKQVLDYTSETSVPEGPIGFQMHQGVAMKVEFRNFSAKGEAEQK